MSHRPKRHRRESTRWYPAIGLLTILVLCGTLYLSFVINDGIPGASVRELDVEVPDANRLSKNNEVRMNGIRAGQVSEIRVVSPPADAPTTAPYARLHLKLDPDVGPVPVDSTVRVRPASVLGATYLDLALGRSKRTLAAGGTLPLARATKTVELTDLLDVFDRSTARNIQRAVSDVGGGLAGRGPALGETISGLAELAPGISTLSRTLASPRSRLADLIRGYDQTVSAFDARRPQLDGLLDHGATTLASVSRARSELATTLDRFPSTAATTTRVMTRLRPALRDLSAVSRELLPAADAIPSGARAVDATLQQAAPVLRRLPTFSGRLGETFDALDGAAKAPATAGTFRKVEELGKALEELLSRLTPAQVHCNVISLWAKGFAESFSTLGVGDGPSIGVVRLNSLGTTPVEEMLQNAQPLRNLHSNYLPNENANECESGNEPFDNDRRSLSNPAGLQSTRVPKTAPAPELPALARSAGLVDEPPAAAK